MTDKIIVEFIPASHWWKLAKWKLKEDYTSANGKVTVPAGFISNGATVPWFARKIFSPTGKYFGATIVHDYILADSWNWKKANYQFWEELTALGVKNWRKATLLWAVKLYYRWLKIRGKA